MIKNSAYRLIN